MKKLFIMLLFIPIIFSGLNRDGMAATALRQQTLSVNGRTVQLQVPEGMRVDFVAPLNSPRFLALGPGNELLVGTSGATVYRLPLPYTKPEILVTLTGRNHSVAYREGAIYVAETGGLYTAPYSGPGTTLLPSNFSLVSALPSQTGGHWSRTVVVGPDSRLYVGIGVSSNCPDEYLDNSYPFERRRGGVYLLDETGGSPALVPYSSGLRNPIGLAFHPDTGVLYATNAGPDNLGFDQPPEIFSPLSQGSFHGMPWFQFFNGAFQSGQCATSPAPRPAGEATPPAVTFAARSTPQGFAFVNDNSLGPAFIGNALVAVHGSWATPPGGDSSTRRAPKIAMVMFSGGIPVGVTDVVTGFQRADGTRFARPSGMIMGPDGRLYFTSDGGEVTGLFRLTPLNMPPVKGPATASINSLLLKERPAP